MKRKDGRRDNEGEMESENNLKLHILGNTKIGNSYLSEISIGTKEEVGGIRKTFSFWLGIEVVALFVQNICINFF